LKINPPLLPSIHFLSVQRPARTLQKLCLWCRSGSMSRRVAQGGAREAAARPPEN